MRREQFTIDVSDVSWLDGDGEPIQPTLVLDFDGEPTALRGRLDDANETDFTFRLHGSLDDPNPEGVVAVTDRLTGEYVLEVNADAESIVRFIAAARRYGEHADTDARYRVHVRADGDSLEIYEKGTFLVYGRDGELLRQHSLIPSGVEL